MNAASRQPPAENRVGGRGGPGRSRGGPGHGGRGHGRGGNMPTCRVCSKYGHDALFTVVSASIIPTSLMTLMNAQPDDTRECTGNAVTNPS
jgi:hypothetical protein